MKSLVRSNFLPVLFSLFAAGSALALPQPTVIEVEAEEGYLFIVGRNFGDTFGTVLLAGQELVVDTWSSGEVVVIADPTKSAGSYRLELRTTNNRVAAKPFEVTLGAIGPAGPKGDPGGLGEQGHRGERGYAGPAGAPGGGGLPGIKGEQGDRGIAGAAGTSGEAGVDGAQGEGGLQGAAGAQGERGLQGDTGAEGAQGERGLQGIQGAVGAAGAQGERGLQGLQGAAGGAGVQGERGLQGIQGAVGGAGAQGERGLQGLQGLQGIAGPGVTMFVRGVAELTAIVPSCKLGQVIVVVAAGNTAFSSNCISAAHRFCIAQQGQGFKTTSGLVEHDANPYGTGPTIWGCLK